MSVGIMRDRSETNPKTEGSTRLNDVKEKNREPGPKCHSRTVSRTMTVSR